MNYIEYMEGGGVNKNVTYTPLKSLIGSTSNLVLKRNNWFKAIQDAILSIKNNNAKNNTVATNGAKSTSGNNVSAVNPANYSNAYTNNDYSVVSRVHRPLGDQ